MPKYSVLELIILENPDFSDLANLNSKIHEITLQFLEEINKHLDKI